MVQVLFLPSESCGTFVLFSIRWLEFLVFWFENFKLFPVKSRFFRSPFTFSTFFVIMELWNCASTWQPCQRYWPCHDQPRLHNVEQVSTWLLSSSLAEFQQFFCWVIFFNFASVYFFQATGFMLSFCFQGLVVLLFCSPYDDGFFLFFGLKISNCSPLKLNFSEGPSFFVRSVCNHDALNLRQHVATLPASLAMSWPAEIT